MYSSIRPYISSGDLLFYRGGANLGSALVRWWTSSRYSHVGVAWCVGDRVLLLEAYPLKGVRLMPVSCRLPDAWLPTRAGWDGLAENYALARLGMSYSFLDGVRSGLGLHTAAEGYQCAEFAAGVLQVCGLGVDCIATPEDLLHWFVDRGYTFHSIGGSNERTLGRND